MKTTTLNAAFVAVAATLFASGCVVRERHYHTAYVAPPPAVVVTTPAPPEVVVESAPPAPIVETVPVAPDPTFVWIGGSWVWHDRWVWEGGRWGRPPHHGAVWVPNHYVYRGGRHVYVRGGWR